MARHSNGLTHTQNVQRGKQKQQNQQDVLRHLAVYAAVLIGFLFLMSLSGCLGSTWQHQLDDFQKKAISGLSLPDYITSIKPKGENTVCGVFACNSSYGDLVLDGANCSIYTFPANKTGIEAFNKAVVNDTLYVRHLGIGGGPTLLDFNEGNVYCNNSYQYALITIYAQNGRYVIPPYLNETVRCLQGNGVIPVLLLYNKEGELPSGYVHPPQKDNAFFVGQAVAGTGPVIVATELNVARDKADFEAAYKEAKKIKQACKNCLVFFSLTLSELNKTNFSAMLEPDYYNFGALLNKSDFNTTIDGIGFGIDSRFSKAGNGLDIFTEEALPLLSFINMVTGKPLFIYYVYLKDDANQNKLFSTQDYSDIYSAFYASAPYLAGTGLIGFAPQAMFEETSLFDCDGCALLMRQGNHHITTQAFNTWFDFCQQYYGNNIPPYVVYNKAGTMSCQRVFVPQTAYGFKNMNMMGQPTQVISLGSKSDKFINCGTCLVRDELPDIFKPYEKLAQLPPNACLMTDEIAKKGGALNLDIPITRAFALDTGVERCYVHQSTSGKGTPYADVIMPFKDAQCQNTLPSSWKFIDGTGVFNLTDAPSPKYNPFVLDDAVFKFGSYYSKATEASFSYILSYGGSKDLGLSYSDPHLEEKRRAYGTAMTIAELSGIDSKTLVNYYKTIRSAGSKNACNLMPSQLKNTCCTKSVVTYKENGKTKTKVVYRVKNEAACKPKNFADWIDGQASDPKVLETLFPDKGDAFIRHMANYAALFDKCNDCEESIWKEKRCNAIENAIEHKYTCIPNDDPIKQKTIEGIYKWCHDTSIPECPTAGSTD